MQYFFAVDLGSADKVPRNFAELDGLLVGLLKHILVTETGHSSQCLCSHVCKRVFYTHIHILICIVQAVCVCRCVCMMCVCVCECVCVYVRVCVCVLGV